MKGETSAAHPCIKSLPATCSVPFSGNLIRATEKNMWLKQTLACQVGAVAVGEDASGRIFYYHLFWPHSHPAGGVMFFFSGGDWVRLTQHFGKITSMSFDAATNSSAKSCLFIIIIIILVSGQDKQEELYFSSAHR